jgi:hypothetical protein
LTLQYTTYQQTNNHQNNGDFDQGEALLSL